MSTSNTVAALVATRKLWEACLAIRDAEYNRSRAHRHGEACDVKGCPDNAHAHEYREQGAQACVDVLENEYDRILAQLGADLQTARTQLDLPLEQPAPALHPRDADELLDEEGTGGRSPDDQLDADHEPDQP